MTELAADAPASYRGVRDPLAFNLGMIRGGTLPSISPGDRTVQCRMRILPACTIATSLEAVRARAALRQ